MKRYHDPGPGALIQIALAPCSPFSVTKSLMAASADLARQHNARLNTHLAETHDEDAWCLETFGMRPLEYLEDTGWLGHDVGLAHGIHFSDPDISRLVCAGVSVTHCPCSNMAQHADQCRICELEAAGVAVGLRVDGSAACLGRSDLGRITVGGAADLACYTLDKMRFSSHGDPIAALVNCGAHHADRMMCAGRWTVWEGTIPDFDIVAQRRDHHRAALRVQTE